MNQLIFAVYLKSSINQANITVADNETEVKLSCEMSQYIHPDQDLKWFKGEKLLTNGSKYTITYHNGSGQGQNGSYKIGLSRMSMLVISDPQTTDAGIYTCNIHGTNQSIMTLLSVVETKGKVIPYNLLSIMMISLYSRTFGRGCRKADRITNSNNLWINRRSTDYSSCCCTCSGGMCYSSLQIQVKSSR